MWALQRVGAAQLHPPSPRDGATKVFSSMRVALLSTPSSRHTASWVRDQLAEHGHDLDQATPDLVPDLADAPALGHRLADRWGRADRPDVVLALGWEAGLAAQVATRTAGVPVALRLAGVGRAQDSGRCRLETALARTSDVVLVRSVGEADRLVSRGVSRALLRVLPEAVDRRQFADGERPSSGPPHRVGVTPGVPAGLVARLAALADCRPVLVDPDAASDDQAGLLRSVTALVAVTDGPDDVTVVLRAMSCGVPTVATDHGALSDLVADGVTGLLVRPAAVLDALRTLLADPLRAEGLGLAAVDRAQARFDVAVVGAALDRELAALAPARMAEAS